MVLKDPGSIWEARNLAILPLRHKADASDDEPVGGCESCGHGHWFNPEVDDCTACDECPGKVCHGGDGHSKDCPDAPRTKKEAPR